MHAPAVGLDERPSVGVSLIGSLAHLVDVVLHLFPVASIDGVAKVGPRLLILLHKVLGSEHVEEEAVDGV